MLADLRLLRPVIQIYRGEQWYQLLEEALLLALDCARQLGDEESILRYTLELLSNGISLISSPLTSLEFRLETNRDAFTIPSFISTPTTAQSTTKPEITINATEFVSFGFIPLPFLLSLFSESLIHVPIKVSICWVPRLVPTSAPVTGSQVSPCSSVSIGTTIIQ